MKVIVLGGAGDMGSRAVEDLAASDGVERVTIADRNVTAARALAARCGGCHGRSVDVRAIDADDHATLVEAIRGGGYDVAASALGPFHRYELKLARAAIEAGVDYASVCDEWEAAEAVFRELDGVARDAGRIIVTGLGASPGLSNVGVRYLAQQMEQIRRADISVFQPLDAGGGEAVLRHMLFIMTGDVAVWRGGMRRMVPACSEERVVEFPRFGAIKLWNMGHSEPATIPRFIDGVEEVNFFMGFGTGSPFFVLPARLGLFANEWITEAAVALVGTLERLTAGGEPGWGAVRIDVWGVRDGREVHGMLCGTGQMREVTGISLSVGTLMLARRELLTEQGGVYAPEGCLDPVPFIRCLQDKGVEAYEDVAMTRPLATASAS